MRHLVRNLPPLVDGRVPVPDSPGLGIELNEEVLEKYRVTY
jgi:L-alanine-DL-glutamate epimerase-like enolase superfamily enzyme